MVTGDNIMTAKAIAAECGILTKTGTAIEGPDFRVMSPEEQYKILPSVDIMARSSPTDKYLLVKRLLEMGEIVAVTGDGTNDAPALHELLWVNLIMDTMGALALATESPTEKLMEKRPIRKCDSLITNMMWRNIFGQA